MLLSQKVGVFVKQAAIVLVILVLITSVSLMFAGKTDQALIYDRMEAFLKAYNSGDMKGVLACLDAKTRNTYQATLNIGDELIGLTGFNVGISDMFSLGVGLTSDDVMKLNNLKISFQSDTQATVRAIMHYRDLEQEYSENISFNLVKEDGDWYINGGC